MKQKYLALALSAIFATALAGCSSNDNDAPYLPPETPETPEVPETPETPETGGEDDNVGDAASGIQDLNKETTVGGQQYIRGTAANFDRTFNTITTVKSGNETVLNKKKLENLKLDNIVLGRETIKRLDQDEAILRLSGEAVDGFSDNRSVNTLGLQEHNTTGGTENRITPDLNALNTPVSGPTSMQYYDAKGNAVAGVTFNMANTSTTANGYPLYTSTGDPLLTGGAPTYLNTITATPTIITGNGVAVTNAAANVIGISSLEAQQAGLVVAVAEPTGYRVLGQEDTTGVKGGVTVDGSVLTTRIFGNKSQDTTNTAPLNSYRFTESLEKGVYKNLNATNALAAIQNMKLNHVQYGRVTSNIDKLDALATTGRDGTTYYQSEIADSRDPNGTPGEVDTYFYRGTGETKTTDMDAFFANEDNIKSGKVSYAGHAVMYGIDNTYHGNQGNPDTNAPGASELAMAGLGNFVQATVNIADKTIDGSIFNVWAAAPDAANNPTKFVKDNLVTFDGTIYGNTARGDSQLAYGSKDEGAFKGSFFGTAAQEFGGSVNSIDSGSYGKAAWGGVFGTQRTDQVIQDSNANQTE